MSTPFLPPELLLQIFYHTFTETFSDSHLTSHQLYVRDLLSFSLVHSTWTTPAQSLLVSDLKFSGGKEDVFRTLREIETDPFRTSTVKRITWNAESLYPWIFEPEHVERWKYVVSFSVFGIPEMSLEYLTHLPSEQFLPFFFPIFL